MVTHTSLVWKFEACIEQYLSNISTIFIYTLAVRRKLIVKAGYFFFTFFKL